VAGRKPRLHFTITLRKNATRLLHVGGLRQENIHMPVYQKYQTQAMYDYGVLVATHRAKVELDIVRLLLAERQRGMAILKAAGVTYDHFGQPDCGAMYLAVMEVPAGPIIGTLELARKLLRAERCWDEATPECDEWGSRWSTAKLVRFASSRTLSMNDGADLAELAMLAVELAGLAEVKVAA